MNLTARRTKSASSAEKLLSRLVRAAQQYHECWQLCDQIRRPLEQIKQAGIWVAAGEAELLSGLEKQLEKAIELLREFLLTPDVSILAKLEDLVGDEAWELASHVRDDLKSKVVHQSEMIEDYTEHVSEWGGLVDRLRARLEVAVKVQAPVLREMKEFGQLEAQWARAHGKLRERNYVELDKILRLLEAQKDGSQELANRLEQREQDVRKFNQHAELLLLQSPPDLGSRWLHYTVLLRTPSESSTHGINIESSSTLVVEDSEELRSMLKHVTEAINTGLARKFGAATPGPDVAPVALTREFTASPGGLRRRRPRAAQ